MATLGDGRWRSVRTTYGDKQGLIDLLGSESYVET